ncbi:uncharacterized protein LOC119174717 [Rhipicephalus microplus]|uniref:uncharacterized protein LOC119174717 n=1 Tax=Rhipicephalus microplus TaxID=6941 RepID=UPI003F6CD9E6
MSAPNTVVCTTSRVEDLLRAERRSTNCLFPHPVLQLQRLLMGTLPLFDLRSHPVDAQWETVAMLSLRPQRASYGFLPFACLLGNASRSKAHQHGLPFCLCLGTPFYVPSHHCAFAYVE